MTNLNTLYGGSGGFLGFVSPLVASGKLKFPQHAMPDSGSITTTAARYYTFPIYIDKIEAFSGVKFSNSGAGDNGDKVKVAIYDEAATGGPGTLAKNFGEATLTGAAAIRTLASAWTNTRIGWHYLRIVSDNVCDLFNVDAGANNLGNSAFPIFISNFSAATVNSVGHVCDYVGGTYANFPESTAIADTTSIFGVGPAVALYV